MPVCVSARGAPYIKGGQILGDLVKEKTDTKEKHPDSFVKKADKILDNIFYINYHPDDL
jgi:hypothetical protein